MNVTPPSLLLTMLDVPRGLTEMALFNGEDFALDFMADNPAYVGDGRPVLLIPGLGADEWQMGGMRKALNLLGYDARHWGFGRNWGARTIGTASEKLLERVMDLYEETGRTVTLIGWSLGGLQARLIAQYFPGVIRQVITLGSPFNGRGKATNIGTLYSLLTGEPLKGENADLIERILASALMVPSLSIYSETDGIVGKGGCIDPAGYTKSVAVSGSHVGLATNRQALTEILKFMRTPLQ